MNQNAKYPFLVDPKFLLARGISPNNSAKLLAKYITHPPTNASRNHQRIRPNIVLMVRFGIK